MMDSTNQSDSEKVCLQYSMVDDCQARIAIMNDWEESFINSIKHHLDMGRVLTVKQSDKLENIWDRVTEKIPLRTIPKKTIESKVKPLPVKDDPAF